MPNAPTRFILFLSSYSPLFLLLAIKDSFDAWVLSSILLTLSVVSVLMLVWYLRVASGFQALYIKTESVQPRSTEAMSYIVTYLIPFVGIDLGSAWDLAALAVLLGVIGVLYVNSNLIYINPVLNLMGYHLFEVVIGQNRATALLAKREYIRPGERISVVRLGNYAMMEGEDGDTGSTSVPGDIPSG